MAGTLNLKVRGIPGRLAAVTVLSATLLASGCGASSTSYESVVMPVAPGGDSDMSFDYATEVTVGSMPLPMPTTEVAMGAGEAADSGFKTEAGQSNREIIVTGNVELMAADPAATATALVAYVESIGGIVEARNEWRPTPGRGLGGASLSLRIPAARLNSAVDELSQFGEVTSIWMNQTDVTSQAVDLDARINALQISVTRLTELMATAARTSDLLEVERELSSRQAELDGLRAIRSDLTDRVQMSSLEITITPTPDAERQADTYTGFAGGIMRGWNALVAFLRGLAVVLGAILPWLLAIAILGAIIWPLVRWLRRRRAHRTALRLKANEVPVEPVTVVEEPVVTEPVTVLSVDQETKATGV